MQAQIRIGDMRIGESGRCFVVAEAGSNHNGDLNLGKKLIEAAKECDCDAIKFQAFKAENLVTKKADKAEYQKGRSAGRTQFEMLKDLELSIEERYALIEHAKSIGIPIFYSVFDQDSADSIEEMGIEIFKLGSGELTNIPLMKHVAQKGRPVIVSTGMGTDEEIADAVAAIRGEGNDRLLLMNCSTGYPSRVEDANLRRVAYLESKFNLVCGDSDHTEGIIVSVVAAALGIPLIEKHFTLDKNLSGPDHSVSMDPAEMKKLCSSIRIVEKNPVVEDGLDEALSRINIKIAQRDIQAILGCRERMLSEAERSQRAWARKSLVATRDIKTGETLTRYNISIKRPEEGILPKHYEKVLGTNTKCAIEEGTPIRWEMLG
jgi:sialic acid synthase SpsE